MESGWAAVEKLLHELGDGGTRSPVLRKCGDLLLGGNLAGDEEPEESLRKRLVASRCLGEELLAFRDALAAEADALL